MCSIVLKDLSKQFGETLALRNVSLTVQDGEFFFLLGPSGCGKSTLLRLIAGLESPDSGDVYFDSREITLVPPQNRGIGLVFQNYALWPHMTVFENVEFGLEIRKVPVTARREKVKRTLEIVRMLEMAARYPGQLSGGQQQRVALARALAMEPAVVLLDEPLSNLDTKLRIELRHELRRIHDETKVTMLYVTHDQAEALSLGTTIAVMKGGSVLQIGKPLDLLRSPADPFVRSFLSGTTLVEATVTGAQGGTVSVRTEPADLTFSSDDPPPTGSKATVSIQASIIGR